MTSHVALSQAASHHLFRLLSPLLLLVTSVGCDGALDASPAVGDDGRGINSQPDPAAWLPLGPSDVRLPDHHQTGASLQRSAFDAALVPLDARWVVFDDTGRPWRSATPTTVRVVLDKVESLRPGLVRHGELSLLGRPERLTLIAGDRLEITTWAGNYTRDARPVITGVTLGGIALGALLSGVTLRPASGGGAVQTVVAAQPIDKGGVYFGQRLASDQYGGFVLSGTVRAPLEARNWSVDVQAVAAFSNESLTGRRTIDYATALAAYRGTTATLHQQGQFYGDYQAESVLSRGERRSIAAPGSWGYHGTDYLGNTNADGKQAAYWVPLRVRLWAGASTPRSLRLITSTGKYVDPNAIAVATRVGTAEQRYAPTATIPFVNGMELTITFLGTSATALAVVAD